MIRSAYSFRNSVGKIEEVVSRVKEIGWQHLPIADYCSTFAHGYIKDQGLKPIYGVTIPVTSSVASKKPIVSEAIILATNSLYPVNNLLQRSFENFRYTPLIKYSDIQNTEGVIVIFDHKARLEQIEPAENIYIGLSGASSKGYINRAKERGFKFCAMQNNRYPRKEDIEFYELLVGRGASSQTYNQFIMSDDEWLKEVVNRGFDKEFALEALANRDSVFKSCENLVIPQAKLIDPQIDKPLRQICEEGAIDLGIDLTDKVYRERLELELSVIANKGLDDYFKIFSDFMHYARSITICGPARGSASGSLVAYLSKITAVNPVSADLLFFRFLSNERGDNVDVDLDISSDDREKVIDYLIEKYGKDRVAKLGTIANFQAKNTIDEVTKGLGIPKYEADGVAMSLPKYAANDARNDTALKEALETTPKGKAFMDKHPNFEVAKRFGGHPRHAGTHAAGVVILDQPINNFFSVDTRTNTIQADGKVAEAAGALKADILALIELSIFKRTLELAGLPMNHLETVPLDDPNVFSVLNEKKLNGIFQLSGRAARVYANQIEFTSIEDICSISAIARPGAMQSGAAEKWVRRKNGTEEITYPHPLFEPHLKNTLGVLIMQESLMTLCREAAGMEWGAVTALRKAVGKSLGPEAMAKHKEPFVTGMVKNGIPQETAESFWQEILGWGAYGFSRNHSYSYAIISYWCAYLKYYHGKEYAAAMLTYRDSTESQIELLREMAKEGVEYQAIDPDHSTDRWRVVNGKLIGPLTLIKGLGAKKVLQILSARARSEPLPESIQKLLSKPVTAIDTLTPIATAISKLDTSKALRPETVVTPIAEIVPNDYWQKDFVICVRLDELRQRDEMDADRVEARKKRGQSEHYSGQSKFIDLRVSDDSESGFLVRIKAKDYHSLAEKVLDKPLGKSLFAMKVDIMKEIKMGFVTGINFIGETG